MSSNVVASDRIAEDHSGVEAAENWLKDVSTKPQYSIGKVVQVLQKEFPALSVSKLRFLEEQGIVQPKRTATGYRKFSEADLQRLRYCLRAQRDYYLPLKVISEHLEALARGEEVEIPQSARVVAKDGVLVAEQEEGLITLRAVMDATGLSLEDLERYRKAKLISPDLSGRLPARSHRIVRLVMEMEKLGIAPSQLTFLQTNADRTADLLKRAHGLSAAANSGVARERRRAKLKEQAQIQVELFRQMLIEAIDGIE